MSVGDAIFYSIIALLIYSIVSQILTMAQQRYVDKQRLKVASTLKDANKENSQNIGGLN